MHQLEHFVDDARAIGLFADTESDVLRHGKVRKQGVILKHHADAALLRRQGETGTGNDGVG